MEKQEIVYAGFWRRFSAYIIDGVITGFFINAFYWFLVNQVRFGTMDLPLPENLTDIIFTPLVLIITWCYYSGMESSPLQATLGKLLVGIYVTDLEKKRISFGKATGRFFGKIISAIILTIGYWLAGFTEKKQALHDMIAGCLVLKK